MLIEDSLSAETIEIVETCENTAAAIARLSIKLSKTLGMDAAAIERAVLARETTHTTAFANGAAIPHCRLLELTQFGIGLMVIRKPIHWDNEGHAVNTVLMIAGPSQNVPDHLRILANSSQLLDSQALRARLKEAPSPAGAYSLVVAAERAVEQRRSEQGMLRELHKDQANGVDYLSEVLADFQF